MTDSSDYGTIEQMKLTDLKKRVKTYGPQTKALLSVLAVYAVLAAIGHGCPIRFVTGIPCPGCGLSRAYLALLELDFAGAFRYHPLFWAVPLLFGLCLWYGRKKERAAGIAAAVVGAAFLGVYLYRLSTGDPAVAVDIRSGLIYRMFSAVFRL